MAWGYLLISLILGVVIGITMTSIYNHELNKKNKIQYKLEKNTFKLNKYRKELTKYFVNNLNLFDSISNNYRQLYHKILKDLDELSLDQHTNNNSLFDYSTKKEIDNKSISMETQPRDYPKNENTSSHNKYD